MIKTYNFLHKYDLHICTVCIHPIARESLGWLHFGWWDELSLTKPEGRRIRLLHMRNEILRQTHDNSWRSFKAFRIHRPCWRIRLTRREGRDREFPSPRVVMHVLCAPQLLGKDIYIYHLNAPKLHVTQTYTFPSYWLFGLNRCYSWEPSEMEREWERSTYRWRHSEISQLVVVRMEGKSKHLQESQSFLQARAEAKHQRGDLFAIFIQRHPFSNL